MAVLNGDAIRTRDDLARFETEMTLDQRLPERSILDVFIASAQNLKKLAKLAPNPIQVRAVA